MGLAFDFRQRLTVLSATRLMKAAAKDYTEKTDIAARHGDVCAGGGIL